MEIAAKDVMTRRFYPLSPEMPLSGAAARIEVLLHIFFLFHHFAVELA